MKKVIDCFMFCNELDILEGRLEYLYDHVDHFILVDCNLTQNGMIKPMHFTDNLFRYKKYLDKILYFPYLIDKDTFDFNKKPSWERDYNSGPWHQENGQRNHIATALKIFKPDDIVMISDLDEIPHKDCINIARDYFSKGWDKLAVEQDHFCYNFKQKQIIPWRGTTISTNRVALDMTPQGLRNDRYGFGAITGGGWHLTYWMDLETIRYKIETFAHQELNQDRFKDLNYIRKQIISGKDMFDRSNEYVTVDPEKEIPEDIRKIFGKIEKKNLEKQYGISN